MQQFLSFKVEKIPRFFQRRRVTLNCGGGGELFDDTVGGSPVCVLRQVSFAKTPLTDRANYAIPSSEQGFEFCPATAAELCPIWIFGFGAGRIEAVEHG